MIDSLSGFHHILFDPDRVPLAMAAVLLAGFAGIVTGPMFGNANPFFWLVTDRLLGSVGARLDRAQRKAADLIFRGMLLTFPALILFYIAGGEAAFVAGLYPLGGMTEIFFLSLVLTVGSVWFTVLKLFFAMKDKKISKNAYYAIARTTRNDLTTCDEYTITRIGMGMTARAFDKGVVAPVVWYLIAGLAGAYIYAGVSALAWRFGKDGFTKGFGRLPLALEQLMGFVPNALAGGIMAGAGLLTPTGGMARAFAGLARKKGRAPYAEGGVPVTAMANALHVAMGGPTTDIDGSAVRRAWVGPDNATAQLNVGHLRRAMYISLMAHLMFLAGLGSTLFMAG